MYGAALIKKRKYWPAGVPGDSMQQFFDQDRINVGDCNAVQGVMDGTTYNLWGMKEPNYVMWMMAMGGPLGDNETCKETICYWKE